MNGKGSVPRNCFSQRFRDGYDAIDWHRPKRLFPVKFKVGDIVRATASIHRQDWGSVFRPGEKATISSVWQTTPDCPQVIGLRLDDGRAPMSSIVCFADVPLELVAP